MNYSGNWHITEMATWDNDYLNMVVQAFIKIDEENNGEFQFGLVCGEINGKIKNDCFKFTWDGNDEYDDVCGSGWLKLINKNTLEGEIEFHSGDSSTLIAKRVSG
jgi:hypothetical protein